MISPLSMFLELRLAVADICKCRLVEERTDGTMSVDDK
jgi:hypothetical protein